MQPTVPGTSVDSRGYLVPLLDILGTEPPLCLFLLYCEQPEGAIRFVVQNTFGEQISASRTVTYKNLSEEDPTAVAALRVFAALWCVTPIDLVRMMAAADVLTEGERHV